MIIINKKTTYLKILLFTLTLTLLSLSLFLHTTRSLNKNSIEAKTLFLKLTKQPDLAISTEADFIRNRSLATFFTTFKDSPELLEYSPSTFSINTNIGK